MGFRGCCDGDYRRLSDSMDGATEIIGLLGRRMLGRGVGSRERSAPRCKSSGQIKRSNQHVKASGQSGVRSMLQGPGGGSHPSPPTGSPRQPARPDPTRPGPLNQPGPARPGPARRRRRGALQCPPPDGRSPSARPARPGPARPTLAYGRLRRHVGRWRHRRDVSGRIVSSPALEHRRRWSIVGAGASSALEHRWRWSIVGA
jgi:hypothetical protein